MKFYTWKDIDRHCKLHRNVWKDIFQNIDVYNDLIIVQKNMEQSSIDGASALTLKQLFGDKYLEASQEVLLDIDGKSISIEFQDEEVYSKSARPEARPTFSDSPYYENVYPLEEPEPLAKPVIAFHSYKGGVGRTLSVIAFSRAWPEIFLSENKNSRLLIVDADIEAPGLTWLTGYNNDSDVFSYLDLLEMIQNANDDEYEDLVKNASALILSSILSVETETQSVEHFFIPAYRYEEQLLDLYATPNSIIRQKNKRYVLATVLSKIAAQLECDAVVVDLRAGISEHSSAFLFDPRIQKFFVTSTSSQSICGTCFILSQLMKGLIFSAETKIPKIFLNMIPSNLADAEKEAVIVKLQEVYPSNSFTDSDLDSFADDVVIGLPFASELIHETTLEQIIKNLSDRKFYVVIKNFIQENYVIKSNDPIFHSESDRKEKLENLRKEAQLCLTAESVQEMNVLLTKPIRTLIRKFQRLLPRTVIIGSKGSGKTFMFRKMVQSYTWSGFCTSLAGVDAMKDTFFVPLIIPQNSINMMNELRECISLLNSQISGIQVKNDVFQETADKINNMNKHDWTESTWDRIFAEAIGDFGSLNKVNEILRSTGKKIIFLIDGLEELFRRIGESQLEQNAVRLLCQNIISNFSLRYSNIGIIIFLRKDIVKAAITINYEQFENLYSDIMLNWSYSEALRLAVWLVNQAIPGFYSNKSEIDTASSVVIDEQLKKIWGLKLGKPNSNEAFSSNWILTALSDFNKQLQARDMIRFLSEAAQSKDSVPSQSKSSVIYSDRLLMPTEIRAAIPNCASAKLKEVEEEYPYLKEVFSRIEKLPDEKKYIPLDPGDVNFSFDEEKKLYDEGFLRRFDDNFYVPECIRSALNLKYRKRARPKILALMRRN